MKKLNDVKICFVENAHDFPLKGHAWYDRKYHVFEIDPKCVDDPKKKLKYFLYSIDSQADLEYVMAKRKTFEDLVGYHWTFRNDGNRMVGYDQSLTFSDNLMKYYDDPIIPKREITTTLVGYFYR